MIRQSWVLEEKGADPDSLYNYYPVKIYTDKQLALSELEKQLKNCYFKSSFRLVEVDLIENDNSISDFYNQIEQENPQYQTTLNKVLTETISEPSNKVTNVREWLTTLSLCDES